MVRSQRLIPLAFLVSIGALTPPSVQAQCQTWDPTFHVPGMNDAVAATVEVDLGSGPKLYAGGFFATAGGTYAPRLASWDGSAWASVAGELTGEVYSLTAFPTSGQPALYVGGGGLQYFGSPAGSVMRWNGTSWSMLDQDMNGIVRAFAVFDDGSGPALFAGGDFTSTSGVAGATNRIARWNGSTWSTVGSGLNANVTSLAVFDDGTGSALYAGGSFTAAGAVAANRVAKWNGAAWSALGVGMDAQVSSLCEYDDGSGSVLIAGGSFTMAGGLLANRVAKWNGSFWAPVGSGMDSQVRAVHSVSHTGGAQTLYAGGDFTAAGGNSASALAAWNGSTWSAVGGGLTGHPSVGTMVLSLGTVSSGVVSELCVGGYFVSSGNVGAHNITRWSGSQWHGFPGNGMDDGVYALEVHDEGLGPALYAGGAFHSAGTARAAGIARWNGNAWASLGSDVNGTVQSLKSYNDGSGPALFVGGSFSQVAAVPASNIARWKNGSWTALGAGVSGEVRDIDVFDDGTGPALYVVGSFPLAGGVPAQGIAKWTGSSWQSVGGGLVGNGYALATMTDAQGPALFVAGVFSQAGTTSVQNIARWDGVSWSALGSGLPSAQCYDLLVYDDGAGAKLHAAGSFGVMRWDNPGWTEPCGMCFSLLYGTARALCAFDDGTGTTLYAAGSFSGSFGGIPIFRVSKLSAGGWTVISSTVLTGGYALHAFDDGLGQGADLFVGGTSPTFNVTAPANIIKYRGCSLQGIPFCFGDGLDPIVNIPCPCVPPNTVPNPPGAPGHGCANSLNLGGAQLTATGTTTPDTLKFRTYVSNNFSAFAFMMKGSDVVPTGVAGSDGIRCASGAILRFGGHMAGTNGSPFGQWTYPNNVQTQPVSMITSQPMGQSAYYQLFYRNSAANFCNPATANFSNAYQVVWQ